MVLSYRHVMSVFIPDGMSAILQRTLHVETDCFEFCLWLRPRKGLFILMSMSVCSIMVSVHIVRFGVSHGWLQCEINRGHDVNVSTMTPIG